MHKSGLKKRGNIWHIDTTVRVSSTSISIRETTGCSAEKDAKTVLNRRINEVRAQLLAGPAPAVERTWAEAAAEYIADLEARGKDSARTLGDIKMLLPTIGGLALSHVHQRTIQGWVDAQRGIRASGTVSRALRTVSAVLNFAARVLRDGNQPWLTLAPPRLRAPDWGERQPRPISWEEQDALVAALPDHLIAPVLFALATGARQAEIVTLCWDQQRQQRGMPDFSTWWIPPEIRKGNARKTASQQEGRYLVANRMARAVIEAQCDKHDEYVFPSVKGDSMYRVNNHGWRTACAAVDLPIRFHDLRHTFGARAADAGIPLDVRRSLLGHSHRDITLHYSSPGLVRLLAEVEQVVRPAPLLEAVSHKKGHSV